MQIRKYLSLYNKWQAYRKSRKVFLSRNRNLDIFLNKQLNDYKPTRSAIATPIEDESKTKLESTYYKFNFQNLVLAGGGAKGVAYCGVARALEEHGILNDIDRFAGTSAGAIVAALLSIGYNSHDVEEIMNVNMEGLLKDSCCFRRWHPANKFRKYIGEVLAFKTDNPDITFREAYRQYKKELCIIVTNANMMTEEYCHVKTTPHLSIRDALRMSISIPVELKPFRHSMFGDTSLYIDGAVSCNYPIHCFDGCYLSMDRNLPVNMFKHPFEGKSTKLNLKTLGCLVHSEGEDQTLRDQIEIKCNVPTWLSLAPDTELSRKWKNELTLKEVLSKCFLQCRKVQTEILKMFQGKEEFSLEEFENILNKARDESKESGEENDAAWLNAKTYAETLYGKDVNAKMVFEDIKKSDNKKVTQDEWRKYNYETLYLLQHKYRTIEQKDIIGIWSFFSLMFAGLHSAVTKMYFEEGDVARTVFINTGYINSLNFAMEDEDKTFLIKQGKCSTEEFLKKIVQSNKLERDTNYQSRVVPTEKSFNKEELAKLKQYKTF